MNVQPSVASIIHEGWLTRIDQAPASFREIVKAPKTLRVWVRLFGDPTIAIGEYATNNIKLLSNPRSLLYPTSEWVFAYNPTSLSVMIKSPQHAVVYQSESQDNLRQWRLATLKIQEQLYSNAAAESTNANAPPANAGDEHENGTRPDTRTMSAPVAHHRQQLSKDEPSIKPAAQTISTPKAAATAVTALPTDALKDNAGKSNPKITDSAHSNGHSEVDSPTASKRTSAASTPKRSNGVTAIISPKNERSQSVETASLPKSSSSSSTAPPSPDSQNDHDSHHSIESSSNDARTHPSSSVSDSQYLKNSNNSIFQKMFNLPENENLIGDYSCAIQRSILLHGRMYISEHYVCFFSSIFSHNTTIKLPVTDILGVQPAKVALVFDNSIKIFAQTGPLPIPVPAPLAIPHFVTHSISAALPTSSSATSTPQRRQSHSRSISDISVVSGNGHDDNRQNGLSKSQSDQPTVSVSSLTNVSVDEKDSRDADDGDSTESEPLTPPMPRSTTMSFDEFNKSISAELGASVEPSPPSLPRIPSASHTRVQLPPPLQQQQTMNHTPSVAQTSSSVSYHDEDVDEFDFVLSTDTTTDSSLLSDRQLAYLISINHPSITIHFFASFMARDNALSVIEKLIHKRRMPPMIERKPHQNGNGNNANVHSNNDESTDDEDTDESSIDDDSPMNTSLVDKIDFENIDPPLGDHNDAEDYTLLDHTFDISSNGLYKLFFADNAVAGLTSFYHNRPCESEFKMTRWNDHDDTNTTENDTFHQTRRIFYRMTCATPIGTTITRVHRIQRLYKSTANQKLPFAYRIDTVSVTPDVTFGDCMYLLERMYVFDVGTNQCRIAISEAVRFKSKPWRMRPFISLIQSASRDGVYKTSHEWKTFVQNKVNERKNKRKTTKKKAQPQSNDKSVDPKTLTPSPSSELAHTPAITTIATPLLPTTKANNTLSEFYTQFSNIIKNSILQWNIDQMISSYHPIIITLIFMIILLFITTIFKYNNNNYEIISFITIGISVFLFTLVKRDIATLDHKLNNIHTFITEKSKTR